MICRGDCGDDVSMRHATPRRGLLSFVAKVKLTYRSSIPAGIELSGMCETVKSGPQITAGLRSERRSQLRYSFSAPATLVEEVSGKRIEGCVNDISREGCYVDTKTCFPMGTMAKIRITQEAQRFEAQGKVVFNQDGKGLGLAFSAISSTQLPILEGWLATSRETSWAAANRRRSQRILIRIPVRIAAPQGTDPVFKEESSTLAISAHGALILMTERTKKGQRLILSNVHTGSSAECVVAHIGDIHESRTQIGVAFVLPSATFWHVHFPPTDWTSRHQDARQIKGRPARG